MHVDVNPWRPTFFSAEGWNGRYRAYPPTSKRNDSQSTRLEV